MKNWRNKIDRGAWIGSTAFLVLFALLLPARYGPSEWARGEAPPWDEPLTDRDLDKIKQDTLKVLVLRDALTWERRGSDETGLEFELLERFAKRQKLHLKAVLVTNPDSMLMMLQTGRGDILAAQLSPNGWAMPYAAFSEPYGRVSAVKVSLRVDPIAKKKKEGPPLSDTLSISNWSPFAVPKWACDTAWCCSLNWVAASPEEALVEVLVGRCSGTVLTDAQGTHWARGFPSLAFEPQPGPATPVAFAVRKNAPQLRIELNKWLALPAEKEARRQIAEAYVRSAMGGGPIRQLRTIQFATDSISPFDSLFQMHAGTTSVDWKLLAAMGRKESRFDTTATSQAGAYGLMQIMPATAASLGIDSSPGASGSIKGASIYVSELDTFWRKSITDRDQRLKFTLASYNAGPGHIKDAQRLAEMMGLDPHRWDGHVEKAVLMLSMPRYFCLPEVKNGACRGHETFWYVRDVLATLAQYRRAGVK